MSKTTMPETVQPEANETAALKLDVTVRPIRPIDNLLAFANVTINDSFVVESFRICSGEKGLYVNMPSAKDSQGNWRDTFKPITAEARHQLVTAITEAYGAEIEKMQATLDASRKAAEKPSVTGALKENADKAKAQPEKASGKSEQSL